MQNKVQPASSRLGWKQLALAALTLFVLVFLYTYLPCIVSILYNYWFWILYSSTVQPALPFDSSSASSTQPSVPKILHQTWKTKELPQKWQAAQKSCIDLHPDFEYRLWTDAEAEQLIADKFPWFLDTYKSYPHSIQRADVLRYFVLYEYGGIYLDLDVECVKPLDAFRHANFTTPKTYPVGVSNDVMIAAPKDPFALQLITNLKAWNQWFFVKYATVMFSTGPMFVTIQYALFPHKEWLSVLPADLYGKYNVTSAALFNHLHGSSWHGNDARYIFFLEKYGIMAGCLVALVLVTSLTAWLAYCRNPALAQHYWSMVMGLVTRSHAGAGPHSTSGKGMGISLGSLVGGILPEYTKVGDSSRDVEKGWLIGVGGSSSALRGAAPGRKTPAP